MTAVLPFSLPLSGSETYTVLHTASLLLHGNTKQKHTHLLHVALTLRSHFTDARQLNSHCPKYCIFLTTQIANVQRKYSLE
jgi:hypothetical protein